MSRLRFSLCVAVLAASAIASAASATVTIDWVTVGDPGNAADTTGFGASLPVPTHPFVTGLLASALLVAQGRRRLRGRWSAGRGRDRP